MNDGLNYEDMGLWESDECCYDFETMENIK